MTGKDLKNSILQLAIQGKLVPQDANDEPASELLKRIRKEKEQLLKDGKLKKKDLVTMPISDEEKPFEIPESWEWCRLGEVAQYKKGPFGSCLTKSMFVPKGDDTVKVYEQKNAIQKDWRLGDYYITSEKYQTMLGFTLFPGDIIVSCAGTIGETYQIPNDAPKGIINQALMYVRLYELQIADYWRLFFADMLNHNTAMKGAGSAIKNIPPFDVLKQILIPIPPLKEQQRIVAKIEELMPLVDEYDKAQTQLDELNAKLPEALKKSILQEAIMGKLVPQDPKDEPASELLKRIRKEKEQLVKDGKLKKKDLVTTPISDEEKPFEIPESWEWVRWGTLAHYIQYGFNAPANTCGRIRMVRITDIQNNAIVWDTVPYCDIDDKEIEKYLLEPNDILFARTGGTVGKSFLVKEVSHEAIYAGYLIRTRYGKHLAPDYLKFFMESSIYWEQLRNGTIATAQPNCNGQTLSKMMLPLPPLSEQRRIVAKLEEILPKIDSIR